MFPREGTSIGMKRRLEMDPRYLLLAAPLALAACNAADAPADGTQASSGTMASETVQPASNDPGSPPGDTSDKHPYDGIRADETVQFTGTEPFWGGSVSGTELTYSTPENPDGDPVTVTRFAGRGGVSWSGTFQERPFRLAVTEGKCSDGMSDRTYPFTATLEVLGEQRRGCAWTMRRSFTGSAAP
jgi:uncharacterized membrane protein